MMLTKEAIKRAREFDDAAAEAGGYLDTTHETPSYRIRDMYTWAKINGKNVNELTPAEREQFIIQPKKQAL